jgi:hypothetical protein
MGMPLVTRFDAFVRGEMQSIHLFLPVVWAITSTILGLIVYRGSSVLFEKTQRDEWPIRRVRLVGSICIAALAYLGFCEATPSALQIGISEDAMSIRKVDIQAVIEALEQANASVSSLDACVAISSSTQCQSELNSVRTRIRESLSRLRRLSQ